MSMSISQILQPEQYDDESKKKVRSKVKIFYTFKGSDTHCFCTFDIELTNNLKDRKWVGIPLKQCVASVCSSSPDQIVDNDTAVYSANFEETLTVENWSPLHDSQSKIIWQGHGVLTNILNDTPKDVMVTGRVVLADQSSPYGHYIEVLLQLHPIPHKPSHSNATTTEDGTHAYLPPVRSLWSNKIITANDTPFPRTAASYSPTPAIVERPFLSALYHLSQSHSSLHVNQQQQQQRAKDELMDSHSSISISPSRTEDISTKEPNQQHSHNYRSNQLDIHTFSATCPDNKKGWPENGNSRQLSSPTRPTTSNYQSFDKRRRLSLSTREHQQQQQYDRNLSLASLPYNQLHTHQQRTISTIINADMGDKSSESKDIDNKVNSSSSTNLFKLHHHHRRYPSSIPPTAKNQQASLSTPIPTIIHNSSSSNNALTKTGVDTFYHQSRRKKRDTKPPNVNDIRPFVEIEKRPDGSYVLPAEVDSWTVLDLGTVVWDKAAFHNQRYIYPVGYRVKKWYRSMVDPHSDTQYTCEILDGGDEPIFQLQADDNPTECWRGPTPTTVWTIAVRRAFAIRNMDYGHNPVGPDFFGLRKNTIAKMIQDLPNADKCKNYIWQNFEAMTNPKSKSARRTATIAATNNSASNSSVSNEHTTSDTKSDDMLSMQRHKDIAEDSMVLCSPNTPSIH